MTGVSGTWARVSKGLETNVKRFPKPLGFFTKSHGMNPVVTQPTYLRARWRIGPQRRLHERKRTHGTRTDAHSFFSRIANNASAMAIIRTLLKIRGRRFADLLERDRPLMAARTTEPQKIDFVPARGCHRNQRARFVAVGTMPRTCEPHGDVSHRLFLPVMCETAGSCNRHGAL